MIKYWASSVRALVYDWVVKDGKTFCKALGNIAMFLGYTYDTTWSKCTNYLFVKLCCREEKVLYEDELSFALTY